MVKPLRKNAQIVRGLSIILRILIDDFDKGFVCLFPDITDQQVMDITAAIEWLEQHADPYEYE